jgi:hypothetical protein
MHTSFLSNRHARFLMDIKSLKIKHSQHFLLSSRVKLFTKKYRQEQKSTKKTTYCLFAIVG